MKDILSEFNALLKRNDAVAILDIEDRTEWVVTPKKTVSTFIAAIEAAINDRYDGSCEIRTAEVFDSGYSLEVRARIRGGDGDFSSTLCIYHANKF